MKTKNGKVLDRHDMMESFLRGLPEVKKEAFLLLVRTKTRKDLKAMKRTAMKEDQPDLEMLMEAAMSLRVFIQSGIPLSI